MEKEDKTFDFGSEVDNHAPSSADTLWWKGTEGDNRIRIISTGAVLGEHFKVGTCYGKEKGCKTCALYDEDQKNPDLNDTEKFRHKANVKWLFWVIDRKDKQIKLAKFGAKIMKAISALQKNPDFKFTSIPPYDITINIKNAGVKTAEYQLIASPKESPLTEEETKELTKKHSTEDIVTSMKKKQMKKEGNSPVGEVEEKEENNEFGGVKYPDEIDPSEITF